jgi:hypothetical protein
MPALMSTYLVDLFKREQERKDDIYDLSDLTTFFSLAFVIMYRWSCDDRRHCDRMGVVHRDTHQEE